MKSTLMALTLLLLSSQVHAGALVELGGTYISDSMTASSTSSSSKYAYNLGVVFPIAKNFWGGFSYLGLSQADKDSSGSTTNWASTDLGPYFKYQFGRGQLYSLSAAYNLISKATYSKTGGTSEEWSGTSYLISFGFMPEIKNELRIGVTVNYYSASYTKKVVSSTESSASNSKSWIYPGFCLTKSW